jgi:hypothetical protein
MVRKRPTRRRLHVGLVLAAILALAGGAAATITTADTGSTNTIKVLPATTIINPVGTGASFTVKVAANGAAAISGAGAGLTFDASKLQLTAVEKDATELANGAAFAGFPSAANVATFVTSANASGSIPVLAWSYFDGTSSEAADVDHGIFSATFTVTATGDSTLGLALGATGGILDGTAAAYGQALTVTPIDGRVVNSTNTTTTTTTTAATTTTATTAATTTDTTTTQTTQTTQTTTDTTTAATTTDTTTTETTQTTSDDDAGTPAVGWIGGNAGHASRVLRIHALVFAGQGERPGTADAVVHFASGDVHVTLRRMGKGIAYHGEVTVPAGQPGGAITLDLSANVAGVEVTASGSTWIVISGHGGR